MMNGYPNETPSEQSGVPGTVERFEGFSESLFEILWRRRWIMLLAVVVGLAGGVLYLEHATPLYTSTSRIYVEQTGPRVFERDSSGIVTRWDNYLYAQAERLKATETLSAALKTPEMSQLRTLAGISNQVAGIRQGLHVVVGKKDEILNVSFTSPYPDEAAQIVNTIVDTYITTQEQRTRNTVGEVVRILKEEKSKRNHDLLAKLEAMMEFKKSNEGLALGTDQDSNLIVRELERFAAALTDARFAVVESKSFYEQAKRMESDPAGLRQLVESQKARGIYIAVTSEAASLRDELKRLERDKADSLLELKADHPAIPAMTAEIDRVQRQIAELDLAFVKNQLVIAEQQYLAAEKKQQELEGFYEQQRQQAVVLNSQLAQYTILQSDYEQTKKLCDLLDDSIQRLDVTTEVGGLNVGILETAAPAGSPSEPQKARTMGLALCLGLFAGVGLALLREWKDQRLRSAEEISALLGLPVLGAVPAMSGSKGPADVRGQRVRINPDSREAEAFRTLRTAVFFGVPRDEARTIVVTSPAPGEGKSTVISNLAIAMAQAGQKVLVIDADFRRPTQHKIFKVDRLAHGLSAVLAGHMPLEQAIERSGLDNLDVLTCGPDVPNPAEIIGSQGFADVVKQLIEQYDRILFDSPPVAAVTDPLILAALCDVTILVVRAEQSMRRVSMQARDSLSSVEARLLGVVVNDVPLKSGRYGYYGGYGYRYYGQYGNGDRKRHRSKATVVVEPREMAVPLGEYRAGKVKKDTVSTVAGSAPMSLSEFWKDMARGRRGRVEDDSSKRASI